MRRFTRLTNSKKVQKHAAAITLSTSCGTTFGRVSQALRVTPAMEASVHGSRVGVKEIRRPALKTGAFMPLPAPGEKRMNEGAATSRVELEANWQDWKAVDVAR